MAQIQVESRAEVTTPGGLPTGSIWCVVPPSQLQHYTSSSLSVGASGFPRVDFVATAGTYSANVAFSATLSAGGDLYTMPIGSSGRATYISNLGQVVNDSWTRTS